MANTRQNGFTLIELMIVVTIIAALAAMVVPRLSGRSEDAKIAVAKADIETNISMALKLYELDNGTLPTTEQGLDALMTKPMASPAPENWKGPYLEKKPLDPWKRPYQYRFPGTSNTAGHDLYSYGKDGSEATADDIKNWE